MKNKIFMLILIFFMLFRVTAHAEDKTYVDDFASLPPDSNVSVYENLTPVHLSETGYRDLTAAVFSNTAHPTGSAVYYIENAETISVRALMNPGSLVNFGFNENGTTCYILGVLQSAKGIRAKYDPVNYIIYDARNQKNYEVYSEVNYMGQQAYYFHEHESSGIVYTPLFYGVNIFVSSDGVSFDDTPLSLNMPQVNEIQDSSFAEEVVTAAIPANTKAIKVEINDTLGAKDMNGKLTPKAAGDFNKLAYVEISGADLNLWKNIPDPVLKPEEKPTAPEKKEAVKSSDKKQKADADAPKSAAKAAASTSAVKTSSQTSPATKFEGVITAPKNTAKAESKASPTKEATGKAEETVPEAEAASIAIEDNAVPKTVYYSSSDEKAGPPAAMGILVYIIVLAAGILLLLLKRQHKS